MKKETREKRVFGLLEFVTFFPSIAGFFSAAAILLIQCWRWLQTGEWQKAPMGEFLPKELTEWAIAKEGGLLWLKKIVLSLLSLHASLWFFAAGLVCTLFLYEMAKPMLKGRE